MVVGTGRAASDEVGCVHPLFCVVFDCKKPLNEEDRFNRFANGSVVDDGGLAWVGVDCEEDGIGAVTNGDFASDPLPRSLRFGVADDWLGPEA